MSRREGLGDILVQEQLLAREQLNQARRAADRLGTRLVTILLDQGLVSETALVEALSRSLRMDVFDPATAVDLDAIRQVPFEEADRYRLLPVAIRQHGTQRVLRVAMADPLDTPAIEDIEFSTGTMVEPLIARASDLSDAIRHYYRGVVTRIIPRGRGSIDDRPERAVFGAGLTESSLRTEPVDPIQKRASPTQRVDALVALLVRKGLISQEEYEDQLQAMVRPAQQEDDR